MLATAGRCCHPWFVLTAADLSGSFNKGGPAQRKKRCLPWPESLERVGGELPWGPGLRECADVPAALVKPFPDSDGPENPQASVFNNQGHGGLFVCVCERVLQLLEAGNMLSAAIFWALSSWWLWREATLTPWADAASSTFLRFQAAQGLGSLCWERGLLDAHCRSDALSMKLSHFRATRPGWQYRQGEPDLLLWVSRLHPRIVLSWPMPGRG